MTEFKGVSYCLILLLLFSPLKSVDGQVVLPDTIWMDGCLDSFSEKVCLALPDSYPSTQIALRSDCLSLWVGNPVSRMKPGSACFDIELGGEEEEEKCAISFYDTQTGSTLGNIPVSMKCQEDNLPFCAKGFHIVDFSSFSHGDFVTEPIFPGFQVSVKPFGNGVGPFARVYDTSRENSETNSTAGDTDLDCTKDNKALIIQEGPLPQSPNDNASGGILTLEFLFPADIGELVLLDTERRPRVKMEYANGKKEKWRLEKTGNCGKGVFPMEKLGVTRMSIKFPESGALSSIKICNLFVA